LQAAKAVADLIPNPSIPVCLQPSFRDRFQTFTEGRPRGTDGLPSILTVAHAVLLAAAGCAKDLRAASRSKDSDRSHEANDENDEDPRPAKRRKFPLHLLRTLHTTRSANTTNNT